MKKLLPFLGCVLLAILVLPAFLEPPARDHAQQEAVVLEGAKLSEALAAYHAEFGEYPPGGVAEIIRGLRGENAKQQVFFESPPESQNAAGELLDPWGTPYQITFESETVPPTIRSAGPNRLFEDESARGSDDYRTWPRPE